MFPKMFKIASVASLTSLAAVGSAFAVDLEFYFPVAVGGAAAGGEAEGSVQRACLNG